MKKVLTLIIMYFTLVNTNAQNSTFLGSTKIDAEFKRIFFNELNDLDRGVPIQEILAETDDEVYAALVYLDDHTKVPPSLRNTVLNEFVTIRGTKAQLLELMVAGGFNFLEISKKVELHNDASRGYMGVDALQAGFLNNKAYKGAGVLIGIVDSGLDFFHKDFRNPTDSTTRVLAMWNHNLTKNIGEEDPEDVDPFLTGLNYGVEYSRAELNDELDGSPAGFVRNSNVTDPHGTHVAGTAASNGNAFFGKHVGMAPEAELLIVYTDYSNNSLIDALRWMKRKADLAGKPIVVNFSLGGHFSSHDGKGPVSTAITANSGPGFIVVASAGNEGLLNMHIAKRILDNTSDSLSFTINAYTPNPGAQNDGIYFIGYANNADNVNATVVSPSGQRYTALAGGFVGLATLEGAVIIDNYIDPDNSDRAFVIQVYDILAAFPPATGTWRIVFENVAGGSGTLDIHLWRYGSSIPNTLNGGNPEFCIAQPANSDDAISVGAYTQNKYFTRHDSVVQSISDNFLYRASFSSFGPNRDSTILPNIFGPGQMTFSAEISSLGNTGATLAGSNSQHRRASGTSMSSPAVAGLIALLLEQDPTLTTNEVKDLIKNTANTEPFMGSIPNANYGWGYINGFEAMAELVDPLASNNEHKTHIAADLSQTPSTQFNALNGAFAVQFTPTSDGVLNGFMLHTGAGALNLTDSVNFKLFTSVAGAPGTQVGNTIPIAPSKFSFLSQTHITLRTNSYLRTNEAPYHSEIILEQEVNPTFRTQSFTLMSGTPYFMVIEPQAGGDSFTLLRDNANSGGSLVFSGGSWSPAAGDLYFFANTSSSDFAPLPVTNFNFTAKKVDQNVLLSWKVAGVDALEELILEHKGNFDPEFKTLDKYTGTAAMENAFLHQRPGSGDQFYRLKAVEKGVLGSTYSTTKLVRFDIELSIYPNPSSNGTLNVELPAETAYNIKVSSLDGKTVYQTSSVGSRPFHLNYLPTGIYLVEIGNESFKTHYKWMLSK